MCLMMQLGWLKVASMLYIGSDDNHTKENDSYSVINVDVMKILEPKLFEEEQ